MDSRDHTLTDQIFRERQLRDYARAEAEGLAALRDELYCSRETTEFQAAFDESEPLITVCIATTDRPKLLIERCLKSIREQTYENLQIVVVGDHCIDETEQRVAALGDSRIEFHNLPRRGPYPRPGIDRWRVAGTNASNTAETRARGQFITHLDDDDRYEPNRIETLLKVARENRAEFIWHKFWYLWSDGNWLPWGDGNFVHGQIGTSMVFFHKFFKKVPWDLYAYRMAEPGDWNRFRKIRYLCPKTAFVDVPLTWYHKNYDETPFVAQEGEEFLD